MRDNHPEISEEEKELNKRIIIIVPDDEDGGWCATRGDHISLAESPYGKGVTPQLAIDDLFKSEELYKEEQDEV